ncbi:histidine ammonia-lyase [Quadrisphaera granulorum]|uniref:Histidine ammonia-lyase n=1 Tax=Quadrisphaera granulorum TaxID=317664 RepID=A0A316ADL1_9ACTN|nr:histidine ammonia-lyase [Quadrisphaera granulorum]PWJ55348.1 histidine ammonia-lyase [Quadrisphaera granulorum]SZE95412.1 histidine ammonia-lyase [Quadrisphaera granulorum]
MTPETPAGPQTGAPAPLVLGTQPLTITDVVSVARGRRRVEVAPDVDVRMAASLDWLDGVVQGMDTTTPAIYSVNTGFGSLAGRAAFADPDDAAELSWRLLLSNASGVGRAVEEEVVRATMLIRAASLAQGCSGVRPVLVHTLVAMLNADVHPRVPEYGSLGASGDLIPLAHIALVMSRPAAGELDPRDSGEAVLDGRVVPGIEAMAAAGVEHVVLGAKDGLALVNGTSFSCAQLVLALHDAENALASACVTAAMTMEAVRGFGDALVEDLHRVRGQRGQIEVAATLRTLLEGSALIDGDRETDPSRQPPQDAYSVRCVPQVFGAVKDALRFVHDIVEREVNAVTDNPLVFPELPASRRLKALSGGNFHAEYVALAADVLSIAATEIGSITERRLFRLDDGSLNRGLPDMLVASEKVGLDCGYMLPQYLAAALVSDCKTLAHPDSVDSIPTCANQEDHVSMANNAGRHARQVVSNVETVVGIELLMAAQALELRLAVDGLDSSALGASSRTALELVRSTRSADGRPVDHLTRDVVMYPRVRAAVDLVHTGALLEALGMTAQL